MNDSLISRQAAIDLAKDLMIPGADYLQNNQAIMNYEAELMQLPPAQPQYTELTPEEAASEIASGSTMSAWYWLDDMIRLKQMGYAICRKR